MPPKRYFEFDGLRGLMALWVALAHLTCWCGYGQIFAEGGAAKVWRIFTGADAAAEAFIILSGFAIATLLQREQAGYGRYMVRRVFRIYPVYIISLGLAVWMAPATGQLINHLSWSSDFYMDWQRTAQAHQDANWAGHVWAHVFLLHGMLPKLVLDGVTVTFLLPAWSIGLEEQFYLVAPLLLWLLRRSWGLLVVLGVTIAGQVLQTWWENPVNASLPHWLPFFLVGIGSSYVATWLERLEGGPPKWLNTVAFGVLIAAFFLAREPLPFLIWGVACPVALGLWKNFMPLIGRLVRWTLDNRVARWLGDISYSLYLLHWPLIIMLLVVLHHWRPDVTKAEALRFMLAVGIPMILLLSWGLHQAVEKPFMRLGRRLVSPRKEPETLTVLPTIS
ncbi:MAG: hypothetical protein JWO94_2443 [Verrucomicrobiaceae bacterium]|nr:hypothetical protein [Verrucomicrobiaceae bacterium]